MEFRRDASAREPPGSGLTAEARSPLPDTPPSAGVPGTGTGLIGLVERAHVLTELDRTRIAPLAHDAER